MVVETRKQQLQLTYNYRMPQTQRWRPVTRYQTKDLSGIKDHIAEATLKFLQNMLLEPGYMISQQKIIPPNPIRSANCPHSYDKIQSKYVRYSSLIIDLLRAADSQTRININIYFLYFNYLSILLLQPKHETLLIILVKANMKLRKLRR